MPAAFLLALAFPAQSGALAGQQVPLPGNSTAAVSPDGRRLAFQSDRSGSMQIWVMSAEETGPVQVTH